MLFRHVPNGLIAFNNVIDTRLRSFSVSEEFFCRRENKKSADRRRFELI